MILLDIIVGAGKPKPMNKLQEIKDRVAQKQYNASLHSICTDHFSDMIDEIAVQYATEVAKATLERAAEQAVIEVDGTYGKTLHGAINSEDPKWVARVNRQSILSTEINIEL